MGSLISGEATAIEMDQFVERKQAKPAKQA
jgi:hypothetical protein